MEEIDLIVPGEADATAESETEKRRRGWRERKRVQRSIERGQKMAVSTETKFEWWAGNRALLSKEELAAMLERHEYVHDLLDRMGLAGEEVAEEYRDHLDFIPVDEITAEVVEFVKEHGTAHLGYISKNDLPPDWSSQPFWRDSELMEKLTAENWQTAQYVKYGLLASLPDWQAVKFLSGKAGWTFWQAGDLVGYREDRDRVRYR